MPVDDAKKTVAISQIAAFSLIKGELRIRPKGICFGHSGGHQWNHQVADTDIDGVLLGRPP